MRRTPTSVHATWWQRPDFGLHVAVKSPFDADYVRMIKDLQPGRSRVWVQELNGWMVSADHYQRLLRILETAYGGLCERCQEALDIGTRSSCSVWNLGKVWTERYMRSWGGPAGMSDPAPQPPVPRVTVADIEREKARQFVAEAQRRFQALVANGEATSDNVDAFLTEVMASEAVSTLGAEEVRRLAENFLRTMVEEPLAPLFEPLDPDASAPPPRRRGGRRTTKPAEPRRRMAREEVQPADPSVDPALANALRALGMSQPRRMLGAGASSRELTVELARRLDTNPSLMARLRKAPRLGAVVLELQAAGFRTRAEILAVCFGVRGVVPLLAKIEPFEQRLTRVLDQLNIDRLDTTTEDEPGWEGPW